MKPRSRKQSSEGESENEKDKKRKKTRHFRVQTLRGWEGEKKIFQRHAWGETKRVRDI